MKKLAIFTILLSCCSVSNAVEVENYRTVTKLATEITQKGYFRVQEQLGATCKHNVIYFDLNTDAGKAHLSMLMAAKMSGSRLSTLAYDVGPDTTCILSTVELE